jgi:AmmeMemoRadiSam system protein B/AmmeMemoRadiSam system protein A
MAAAHTSPYSGIWYPPQQRRLNALLDELFETSCRRTGPYVLSGALALLVPHAAPQYSGTVAASAYRHIELAKPERVFILGFSHAGGQRGVAIPNVSRYRTPLGEIGVDVPGAHELCSGAPFRLVGESQACDHSVEIQLPFLQRVAPGARVIPLYVGQLAEAETTAAAETLARACREGDVFVASSDLTHYGPSFGYVPFPVDSQVDVRLRELDRSVLAAASSVDCGLFLETLCKSGATACGYQPISLLLRTLSLMGGEDIFQQELDYQTSGEITGDFRDSVSYAAAGYFRRSSFEVNRLEQHELLLSAQATLGCLRQTGQREIVSSLSLSVLARRAPVFVTLRHKRHVIGCVGRVFHCLPLAEAVPQMTMAAALDDPRRLPDEIIPADVEIEISLLTPMKLVRGADAIGIGRDGVYLECGTHRALLLPQVAGAGWSTARFLDLLFKKAGLKGQMYGDPEWRLYIFEAQVFRADDPAIRAAVRRANSRG